MSNHANGRKVEELLITTKLQLLLAADMSTQNYINMYIPFVMEAYRTLACERRLTAGGTETERPHDLTSTGYCRIRSVTVEEQIPTRAAS